MKTNDYEQEECYKCKKKTLLILKNLPKGRETYHNQTYLKCNNCQTIQLRKEETKCQ